MWLRLTTMRYFLSRNEQESVVFVKEEFLHNKILEKENVFGYFWPENHWHWGRQCETLWSMEAWKGCKALEKFDKVY